MDMLRNNGTYTVYGDDGKVVIISSDRGAYVLHTLNNLKE
jgi:hypothetical protein